MRVPGKSCSIFTLAVFWLAAFLPLVLLSSDEATAQTRYADVPVLVVAEDEDEKTLKRSSDIARRVVASLQDGMSRMGFRVLDEQAVAGDLEWTIRDRRPKMELIQIAKLMSKSGKATHQVRALVLYRTYVSLSSLPSVTRLQVRIECEIHDLLTNQFIASLEVKSPVRMLPPLGGDCDEQCISAVGGTAARTASGLGVLLARKLARYRDASTGGGPAKSPGRGHTMQITYSVTLRYFERREALAIIGVMAEEFPGYKTHSLIGQEPAFRRYSYVSSAKPDKLEEWLTILLKDMNFNPDEDVASIIRRNEIIIEKILPTSGRPKSKDEKKFIK